MKNNVQSPILDTLTHFQVEPPVLNCPQMHASQSQTVFNYRANFSRRRDGAQHQTGSVFSVRLGPQTWNVKLLMSLNESISRASELSVLWAPHWHLGIWWEEEQPPSLCPSALAPPSSTQKKKKIIFQHVARTSQLSLLHTMLYTTWTYAAGGKTTTKQTHRTHCINPHPHCSCTLWSSKSVADWFQKSPLVHPVRYWAAFRPLITTCFNPPLIKLALPVESDSPERPRPQKSSICTPHPSFASTWLHPAEDKKTAGSWMIERGMVCLFLSGSNTTLQDHFMAGRKLWSPDRRRSRHTCEDISSGVISCGTSLNAILCAYAWKQYIRIER